MSPVAQEQNKMDDNNILNKRYNSFGSLDSRKQHKIQFQHFLQEELKEHSIEKQIIVNKSPNRLGKTISTIEILYQMGYKVFFATDRHNQIREIKNTFKEKGIEITQWRGFEKSCTKSGEMKFLYDNQVPIKKICNGCEYQEDEDCLYLNQFQTKNKIVAGPKQFLKSKKLDDFEPDIIVWDEVLDSKDKIKPFIPENLTEEDFNEFNVNFFYLVYEFALECQKSRKVENIEDLDLNREPIESQFFIDMLVKKIRENPQLKYDAKFMDIFQFITKLGNTINWLYRCSWYGYREIFYEPYLINALKLDAHLIILNTSFDEDMYNSIVQSRSLEVHELKIFDFEIPKNSDSYFLFYKVNRRSCSKGALFETDKNGKILEDDSGMPIIKYKYGKDVFKLIFWAIDYCLNKGLKVGVITYSKAKKIFTNIVGEERVGHFGGQQGSNKFDDVDVLFIVGTYIIHGTGLSEKYQLVYNELVGENNWKPTTINGTQLSLCDNEKLNRIKLSGLNEEHSQAIFRSGAHLFPGKIVICFGYEPEGIGDKINRKTFGANTRLKLLLVKYSKILKQHHSNSS